MSISLKQKYLTLKREVLHVVHSVGLWIYCLPANMTVLRGDGTILRKYRRGFGWMRSGIFQTCGLKIMAWATTAGRSAI